MIGSIVGDVVGSAFLSEGNIIKSKEFEFLNQNNYFTGNTIMTIGAGMAILDCNGDYSSLPKNSEKYLRALSLRYKNVGYDDYFTQWIYREKQGAYNSFDNGAAIRVSPVAYFATSIEELEQMSYAITSVTHKNPEAIKGAEAVAAATYLALHGERKEKIYQYIYNNYYQINFTLNEIRPTYKEYETCQMTIPHALQAFFEAISFEDAIRNAVSIGGKSNAIGAITGSIAEAYYGVPSEIRKKTLRYLDDNLRVIVNDFEEKACRVAEAWDSDELSDEENPFAGWDDMAIQDFWDDYDAAFKPKSE